ncbi:hypothetical protein J4434_01260 [Candidatus Woesearchaeota archaeon]|nr:hypothetical protein [Candidatus Woesearchaeota archaeon]
MEDLEAKLKNVLNELSSKLEKQEVSVDEFDRDLFELMNEKKIFTGTYSENCYNIGYYHLIFLDKIKAVKKVGIRTTYVGLVGHFSEQSLRDIEGCEILISNAIKHLKATFGVEIISDSQFNDGLKSFVSIYIKEEDVSQGRREHLVGYLLNLLYSKFRIVSGLHHRIGEYERREIDDALKKL